MIFLRKCGHANYHCLKFVIALKIKSKPISSYRIWRDKEMEKESGLFAVVQTIILCERPICLQSIFQQSILNSILANLRFFCHRNNL